MSGNDRDNFERTRARVERARARAKAALDEVRRHDGVRPGDVYRVPGDGGEPVYLVVLTPAPGEGRWRVLLADDNAVLRPGLDLATPTEEAVPLSVRTDRRAELPSSMLAAKDRLAMLTRPTLLVLQEMARVPRDQPAPPPHDESLSDTLQTMNDVLRQLRADAAGPDVSIPLDEGGRERVTTRRPPPRGGIEVLAATGLAGDGGAGELLRAALANQPTCFVLHIEGSDALSAVTFPRDGVFLLFRGDLAAVPEIHAVYCDHERTATWEAGDAPGEVRTREAFAWEDDSVELRIGPSGYVVRITRPLERAEGTGGSP